MAERVLIVDDDPEVLGILQEFIKRAEYEPDCFLEAQDSISAVQHEKFDLAIVDLKLGKKNGLEVMTALHETNPDMPVIILTGYGTVETAVEAMELGAFNYLTKPIMKDELLFQVKRALERKRLMSEIRALKDDTGIRGVSGLIYTANAEGARMRSHREAHDEFESHYLVHLIDVSGGDIKRAAKSAALSDDELAQLLKKHGISFKDPNE